MIYSARIKVLFYMLIVFGIVLIGNSLLREKIKSIDDLRDIKAKLQGSAFYAVKSRHHRGFSQRFTYHYYVHLDRYNNDFEVFGDLRKVFDKDNFKKDVHAGDSITIQVSKRAFNEINTKKIIRIFGLSGKKASYVDCNHSIEEYNKHNYIFLGFIFLFTGVYFLQRKREMGDNEDRLNFFR